jgi:hypothetical protein
MSNHDSATVSVAGNEFILEYWSDEFYKIPDSKYQIFGFRFGVSGVRKKKHRS